MPREWVLALLVSALVLPPLALTTLGIGWLFDVRLGERLIARLAVLSTLAAAVASTVGAALGGWWKLFPLETAPIPYFSVPPYAFELTFRWDGTSLVMALGTSWLSALVLGFSVNYVHREKGLLRFYVLMLVFASAMNWLVLSGSYDQLFLGWELVGLSSILLVAFFHERAQPIRAAIRVLITYRLCDLGLLLAAVLMRSMAHDTRFGHIDASLQPGTQATLIGLLLLLAASGKSAQLPFGGWLPRAMEGPTPSSAIFYGGLSVHAGIYLLIRSEPIFEVAPLASGAAVVIGSLTALAGASQARVQADAKTSLAWAGMAQLGLMVVEVGFHLPTIALFHLMGHAALRCLQLLKAPNLLHDATKLRKALGVSTLASAARPLPAVLYRVLRDGFFVEVLLERYIVRPTLALGRRVERLEQGWLRRLGGTASAPGFPDVRARRRPAVAPEGGPRSIIGGLAVLAGLPLLGAVLVFAWPEPRHASRVATVVAILHALHAGTGAFAEGSPGAIAITVNAIIAVVVLFAQPRRGLIRRDMALPLAWMGCGALVIIATDARLVLLGWVLPPVLAFVTLSGISRREARARRVVTAYLLLGTLPLTAATFLFGYAGRQAGLPNPNDIGSWHAGLFSPLVAGIVFVLVALAVMVRLGVPPLHSWVPAVSEALPSGTLLGLSGVQIAAHVMVRFALVPLPHAVPAESTAVLAIGVVGLVYGAVMALSQERLRRVVAFVGVAQSSMLLIGLALGDVVSVAGALSNAVSVAITSRGLMLAATMIESRMGPVDLRRMTGLAHAAPRLGTAAFMIALAAVGLPGSLGFVAEDLLLEGLVGPHLVVAFVLVISTALIGIALLRALLRTCGGPAPEGFESVPDLFPRERALVVLAVAALLVGFWPQPLVQPGRAHVTAPQIP